MSVNVVVRVCLGFCIGSLLSVGAAGWGSGGAGVAAGEFSSGYADVFCGMPIGAVPVSAPFERPITEPGEAATINVNIVKFTFDPPNPTINIGDTVRWTNIDGAGHTTTSNGGVWNSGTLQNGQSFSFTFTSAGSFPYRCSIHPSMTANITVRATTPTSTPTSAATPTLGNYPDTSIPLSANTTTVPDAAPALAVRMNVSASTSFKGRLEGDPATGVVRVTDAHPAGTYAVTVTAIDSGGGSVSKTFNLAVTTPAACSPVAFTGPVNFGAATSPRSVAVGDLNGDGTQDLAVANEGSNNVSVLLGNGAGGFGAAANFGVGSAPYSIAVGDFNGDGRQDLVTTNETANNVSILLGNGTGSFGAATNFATRANPSAVAVGNFNGDGYQDLAVVHLGSSLVSILLGTGTGSFSAPNNYSVGVSSNSVAIADLNGDGKQDLVTANLNAGTVSALLGNGTGGFGAATNFNVGSGPASITVGDFNGDGKQDVATANQSSNDVSILLGNGAGSFGAVTNFASGSTSLSVALGDLNSDGKLDLITANSFNLSVLLGNGTGGFGAPANFNADTQPDSVAVGDLNGDGRQDIAIANHGSSNVSVLLRSGCSASSPTPTNTVTNTATPTDTATATFTPTITPTDTPADTPTNTPTNTATATPTPPASPCNCISGTVIYPNAASPPVFISNATVAATPGSVPSTTTAAPGATAGQYLLNGFTMFPVTIGVTKTTGQNSITSNDAARIAQHVISVNELTTDVQKVTADVSNNGTISSLDAALIARYVASAGPPQGLTGNWRFFVPPGPPYPAGSYPTTRTYNTDPGSLTGQDYVGILFGDVTGNWTNTGARPDDGRRLAGAVGSGAVKEISVDLPRMTAAMDNEVVIPVAVRGVADKDVISYEFDLRYDPSVIQPAAGPVDVTGTASRGLSVVTNANDPGLLRVVVYGPIAIGEDGVLLNLRFTAVGKSGAVSPVTFERMMFNEGEPRGAATEGKIELY